MLEKARKKVSGFLPELSPSTFDGTEKVAKRIREKYESGDFSDEQHTVYYGGQEVLVTITEAEGNVFEELRKSTSERTDRLLGIGALTPEDFDATVIHYTSPERTQRMVEAEIARVVS
jgi:hypothetical protein